MPALRRAPSASSPTRGRRRAWLLGAALVGLALAVLAYTQIWMTRPPVVPVEIATPAPVTRVLAVNGRIAAVRSVDVRATVSGRLATLDVAEGDAVDAGQVLAEVDAEAQSAVVRQAVAGLDAALVAQDQARETYARPLALGTNVARSTLETRGAGDAVGGARGGADDRASGSGADPACEHTIRAPMAGTVLVLNADPGQSVDPATVLHDARRSGRPGRRDGCGRILCHADRRRTSLRSLQLAGETRDARRAMSASSRSGWMRRPAGWR